MQICYKGFNSFVAVRKQTLTSDIIVSIVKRIDKTNNNDNIYFEKNDKLSDFNNDNVQYIRPIERVSESDTVAKISTDQKSRQHTTRNDGQVPISLRIIIHQKSQKGNVQEQELSQDTFCLISLMLESTKKICWLQRI